MQALGRPLRAAVVAFGLSIRWLRIATNPLAGQRRGAARFVDDAGHLAAITLQKPVRVAVHAKSLFTRDDGGSGNG